MKLINIIFTYAFCQNLEKCAKGEITCVECKKQSMNGIINKGLI